MKEFYWNRLNSISYLKVISGEVRKFLILLCFISKKDACVFFYFPVSTQRPADVYNVQKNVESTSKQRLVLTVLVFCKWITLLEYLNHE